MLLRADISLTPVARVDGVAAVEVVGDVRQEAFQRSLAGSLGKSLQGEVLSRLTDGSFMVKVAGTPARMLLPQGAEVGQQVPLTLVALSPRPTFQIATQQGAHTALAYAEAAPAPPPGTSTRAEPLVYLDGGQAATPAASRPPAAAAAATPQAELPVPVQRPLSYAAAQLAKAPLTPTALLPSIDPSSTPATISESARTIATVLAAAAPKAPGGITAPAPLTQTPAAPPQEMASALRQSLSESGLFYESHVAEWSAGQRPVETLAREPQMQRAAVTGHQQQTATAAPALPGIDQETAQFINLQLNTQEQGRVVWEGQPWPGQAMRWEVARDAPERQAKPGEQEHDTPWRSGVRLRFPLLGEVAATVVLHGGQLHIQVDTGSSDTGSLLRANAASLSGALEAAGLPLSSLKIRSDGDG